MANDDRSDSPAVLVRRRWMVLSQTVLLAHAVAAIAGWWVMPGGFPVANPHFWANVVVPALLLCVACAGMAGGFSRHVRLFEAAILILPALWAAAALTATLLFPVSAPALLPRALTIIGIVGAAAFLSRPAQWSLGRRAIPGFLACGALFGATIPVLQRSPAPSTLPINHPVPQSDAVPREPRIPSVFPLASGTTILPSDGSVQVRCGTLKIDLQPLLTFESRSPDRCWTVFAARKFQSSPRRSLTGQFGGGDGENTVLLRYEEIGAQLLKVTGATPGRESSIEAFATLAEPVYSHLNSFCSIVVSGHRRLAISFSPCGDARIDLQPADYPTGRPLRSAFIDADRMFHVVEARSGEKGPFRELARGPLPRAEPLRMTLYDDGHAACVMTFDDWADQAGTALSPTAGWGLPVNAIEFSLLSDPPESSVGIWMTLAATSVGRGWDSVGHSAGTYRNRIQIAAAD